jgi:hypothetical protein
MTVGRSFGGKPMASIKLFPSGKEVVCSGLERQVLDAACAALGEACDPAYRDTAQPLADDFNAKVAAQLAAIMRRTPPECFDALTALSPTAFIRKSVSADADECAWKLTNKRVIRAKVGARNLIEAWSNIASGYAGLLARAKLMCEDRDASAEQRVASALLQEWPLTQQVWWKGEWDKITQCTA